MFFKVFHCKKEEATTKKVAFFFALFKGKGKKHREDRE